MISYATPDLTRHPPRSVRTRLGGYVHLPRLIDKARAFAAGRNGAYNFDCPLDKRLWEFTGLKADAFLAAVKSGKSDTEMLAWVTENVTPRRTMWEIETWSTWFTNLAPGDLKRHRIFADELEKHAPGREDLRTIFDRLDFDDYVTFQGRG